jgi:hypothetical protein
MKRTTLFTIVLVTMLASMALSPATAAIGPTTNTTEQNKAEVKMPAAGPAYQRIVVDDQPNVPAELYVSGEQPVTIRTTSITNTTPGTAYTANEGEYFPMSLGAADTNWDNNHVQNPWAVRWYHVNALGVNATNATYTFAQTTEKLGNLEVDAPTEYETPMTGNINQLDLNIRSAGIYVIYYDDDNGIGSIVLVNTKNKVVTLITGTLPDAAGEDNIGQIRKYSLFVAEEAGVHRLYFTPGGKHTTFELTKYTTTKTVASGDRVIYRDETYNNVDPESMRGSTNGMPVHIYEFDVTAMDYYRFRYSNVWSTPTVRICYPSGTGIYTLSGVTTGDANQFIQMPATGKAYMLVLHPAYYATDFVSPLFYKFDLMKMSALEYELGNCTTFPIMPENGQTLVYFDVVNDTSVYINGSIVFGAPTTALAFSRNDGIFGIQTVAAIGTGVDTTTAGKLYNFVPGRYYTMLTSSAGSKQTEYIKICSKIVYTGSLAINCPTKTNGVVAQVPLANMPLINYPSHIQKTDADTELMPSMFNFTYLDTIGLDYNVSFNYADNAHLTATVNSDLVIFIWNGTEYLNVTGSPEQVAMFVNGSASTYPVYIGSTQMFDRLQMSMITNFSGANDDYEWAYHWDNAGTDVWTAKITGADIVSDTSHGANGTLQQNGVLSLDPTEFNWEIDTNGDPDGGGPMPDTSAQRWWIRLECNHSTGEPANIPTIVGNAQKAYQHMNMRFDLKSRLFQKSEYDMKTLNPLGALNTATNQAIRSNDQSELIEGIQVSTALNLAGNGSGALMVWPFDLQVYDYRSTVSAWVPLNNTLNFRAGLWDDKCLYVPLTYGVSATPAVDSTTLTTTFNHSAFANWAMAGAINGSTHSGVIISCTGTSTYDWYQFILSTWNEVSASTSAKLWYDNVWTANNGPATAEMSGNWADTSDGNGTYEQGIYPSEFKLVLWLPTSNPVNLTYFWLTIGRNNVSVLIAPVPASTLPSPPTPPPEGLPEWVLPVAIGGGVALIVVIGVVVYKKKNPI